MVLGFAALEEVYQCSQCPLPQGVLFDSNIVASGTDVLKASVLEGVRAKNPLMRTRINLSLIITNWRDVIARSSALISSTGNLVSQYQHDITCTVKQIVLVGRPEALSLPGFIYKLSAIYQKPQNASEQNCSVC